MGLADVSMIGSGGSCPCLVPVADVFMFGSRSELGDVFQIWATRMHVDL
jgi:hypothetical protein